MQQIGDSYVASNAVVTGDVVNDLASLVGDPNVTIHEAKVFVCRIEKG